MLEENLKKQRSVAAKQNFFNIYLSSPSGVHVHVDEHQILRIGSDVFPKVTPFFFITSHEWDFLWGEMKKLILLGSSEKILERIETTLPEDRRLEGEYKLYVNNENIIQKMPDIPELVLMEVQLLCVVEDFAEEQKELVKEIVQLFRTKHGLTKQSGEIINKHLN